MCLDHAASKGCRASLRATSSVAARQEVTNVYDGSVSTGSAFHIQMFVRYGIISVRPEDVPRAARLVSVAFVFEPQDRFQRSVTSALVKLGVAETTTSSVMEDAFWLPFWKDKGASSAKPSSSSSSPSSSPAAAADHSVVVLRVNVNHRTVPRLLLGVCRLACLDAATPSGVVVDIAKTLLSSRGQDSDDRYDAGDDGIDYDLSFAEELGASHQCGADTLLRLLFRTWANKFGHGLEDHDHAAQAWLAPADDGDSDEAEPGGAGDAAEEAVWRLGLFERNVLRSAVRAARDATRNSA
jgi:hypothetical protein